MQKQRLSMRLPSSMVKAIHEHCEAHPWKTPTSLVHEAIALLLEKEAKRAR